MTPELRTLWAKQGDLLSDVALQPQSIDNPLDELRAFWREQGIKTAGSRLREMVRVTPDTQAIGTDAFNVHLGDKQIGRVSGTYVPEGFNIHYTSMLPSRLKGLGLGKKIYGEIARQSPNRTVFSDSTVSPEAQRVYASQMKNPAYSVLPSAPDTSGVAPLTGQPVRAPLRQPLGEVGLRSPTAEPLFASRLVGTFPSPQLPTAVSPSGKLIGSPSLFSRASSMVKRLLTKRAATPGWSKQADLLQDVALQPHQQRLSDEIDPDHPARKLLVWQTGSGKTLGAIAGAEKYGQPYTVIAPAAVRPGFQGEQTRFTDSSVPSSVISYQRAMRDNGIDYPESLVIDEAQRIINPGTKQSQKVVDAAQRAKQVLMLSGTPIVNRPGDLAAPISALTGKTISPTQFEEKYLGEKNLRRSWSDWWHGRKPKTEPVIRNAEQLKEVLRGKVDWYSPKKAPVETKDTTIPVTMSPQQAKLHQSMMGKIPLRLRLGLDGSVKLSAKELSQLRAFLVGPRQASLSEYPFSSSRDPYKAYQGSTKLQAAVNNLKGMLEQDKRRKAIIYSNFPRAGLHPYQAALDRLNIPSALFDGTLSDQERKKVVQDYNAGKSRVALIGPAGAEGISLKGTQLIQLLDPHWNDARLDQAKARGIRFDSHSHLPPELQNVDIQRYVSKLPPAQRSLLQMLRLKKYNPAPRPGSDDYLMDMSAKKDKKNQLFLDLLKEVGEESHRKEGSMDTLLRLRTHWRKQSGIMSILSSLPGQAVRGFKNLQKQTIVPKMTNAPLAHYAPPGAALGSSVAGERPIARAFGSVPTPRVPTSEDHLIGSGIATGLGAASAGAALLGQNKQGGLFDNQPSSYQRSYLPRPNASPKPASPMLVRGLGKGLLAGVGTVAAGGLLNSIRNFLSNSGAAQAPGAVSQAMSGQTAPAK